MVAETIATSEASALARRPLLTQYDRKCRGCKSAAGNCRTVSTTCALTGTTTTLFFYKPSTPSNFSIIFTRR